MRLIKIELKNFKLFRFPDFPAPFMFSPGINVVKGPLNETGKSTLLKGIVAALFYDVKSVKKEVKDCVSWGSDRQYETLVEFKEKGKTYSLYKDFEKGLVNFIGHNTGEKFDTSKKVLGRMKELLGTESDKFFSLTSCIYQDDVKAISSGKKEISDSLEEVVTGGKEGILASQAMNRLETEILNLKRGLDQPAKYPGPLKHLRDEINNTKEKLSKVRKEVANFENSRIELKKLATELEEIEKKYENAKILLDNNNRRIQIERSIKEREAAYNNLERLSREISELEEGYQKAEYVLSSIDGLKEEEKVSEIRRGLDNIENERKGLDVDLESVKKDLRGKENEMLTLNRRAQDINLALDSTWGLKDREQISQLSKQLAIFEDRHKNTIDEIRKREGEIEGKKEELQKKKVSKLLSSKPIITSATVISTGSIVGAIFNLIFLWGLVPGLGLLIAALWSNNILTKHKTEIVGLETQVQSMRESLGESKNREKEILMQVKCESMEAFRERERNFYQQLEERDKNEKEITVTKTESSGLEERIKRMKARLEQLSQEESKLLSQARCGTRGEFEKREREFRYWLNEKRRYNDQLKGKLGTKSIGDINQDKVDLARKLRVEEDRLTQDLKTTTLSPEELVELNSKVQHLEKSREKLKRDKERCEFIIERGEYSTDNQVELEECLRNYEEDLEREGNKVRIYELAKDFISRARDEALSSITDILKEGIQEYFEIFTNGKYRRVEINKDSKGNLEFWVYSNEKGGLAKPEELSGGVIDEFYLACRLALVKLIFGDKKPPIILDDPFVNFDSVRLANTLNFFKMLASEYQIIIFTLSDLYDKVADNIILLGEKERPL
jgi:DNA repair exonuclease SbcCD ATPase subunit